MTPEKFEKIKDLYQKLNYLKSQFDIWNVGSAFEIEVCLKIETDNGYFRERANIEFLNRRFEEIRKLLCTDLSEQITDIEKQLQEL